MMEAKTDDKTTYCKRHPDTSSRLRCSHCNDLICPKCMVMCDVGIKCPTCVQQTKSHILQVDQKHLLIAGVLGFVLGHGFGWLHPILVSFPFFYIFGIPVAGLVGAFVLGRLAGNLIRWAVHYKSGPLLSMTSSVAVLTGLLLSPLMLRIQFWMNYAMDSLQYSDVMKTGTSSVFMWMHLGVEIFLIILFVRGLQETFK